MDPHPSAHRVKTGAPRRSALRATLAVAVVLLLVAVTRLPQLVGGRLTPDGDECVIGLMAMHAAEGRELPVFFWGQRYGFTLVEATTAALLFRLGSASPLLLKIAQLLLWSLGVLCVVGAARRLAGERSAVVAALLLVFAPAWGLWSLKASGGYVTAFVAAHAIVWWVVAARDDPRSQRTAAAGVGILMPVVFWSQPLWIPPTLPFVGSFVLRRRSGTERLLTLGCALVGFLALLLASRAQPAHWSPPTPATADVLGALRDLPTRLLVALGGSFYFAQDLGGDLATRAAAVAWIGLVLAAIAAPIARRLRAPRARPLGLAGISVLAALAPSVLFGADTFFFRYLLPVPGFAVLAVATEASTAGRSRRGRVAVVGALALVVALGAATLVRQGGLSRFGFPANRVTVDGGRTQRLIDELLRRGVHHVYCTDPMFQWNITFLSGERVIARWTDPRDRRPEYPAAVDRALRSGRRVAVVGDARSVPRLRQLLAQAGLSDLRPELVADLFYVLESPPEPVIRAMGFTAVTADAGRTR